MSEIVEFIEEYNRLVIGDEKCAYFSIVQSDTRWRSFVAPLAEPDRVLAAISGIAQGLPVGSHVLFIQAVAPHGGIMGQISVTVDGRSQAAKKAHSDQLATVKGSQMIVETAESQINLAMQRAESAERRAQALQEQINEQQASHLTLVETCSRMLLDQERAQLDEEDRRARIEMAQNTLLMATPALNYALEVFMEHLTHKREKMQKEHAAEKAAWKGGGKKSPKPSQSTTKSGDQKHDGTEPTATN